MSADECLCPRVEDILLCPQISDPICAGVATSKDWRTSLDTVSKREERSSDELGMQGWGSRAANSWYQSQITSQPGLEW